MIGRIDIQVRFIAECDDRTRINKEAKDVLVMSLAMPTPMLLLSTQTGLSTSASQTTYFVT